MTPSDTFEPLVQEYVDAASIHGAATARGDSAAHDTIAAIYRRLREQGVEGRLLPLLSHGNPAQNGVTASSGSSSSASPCCMAAGLSCQITQSAGR